MHFKRLIKSLKYFPIMVLLFKYCYTHTIFFSFNNRYFPPLISVRTIQSFANILAIHDLLNVFHMLFIVSHNPQSEENIPHDWLVRSSSIIMLLIKNKSTIIMIWNNEIWFKNWSIFSSGEWPVYNICNLGLFFYTMSKDAPIDGKTFST